MNNLGPKLRDADKAGSLGELDHYIVEIGGKIYRVPATYVSNLLTGNKYGVAYTATQPPASPKTGDWYFAGENGGYPNFGVTGVTSGGFIVYDTNGWVFVKNSNIKPPFFTTDAEPNVWVDKNDIVYWTLPAATGNVLRLFSVTEGTSGKIYVKTTADNSSIALNFHPVADENQGHIEKVVISKQTDMSPIAGETTLIYWRVINGMIYLEYTNAERKIFLSDTDPSIVTTPAEKRVIFGTSSGKMWSKNSNGVIEYYTTENKSEYISQGNSYVENGKEAIRTAGGKVYASVAGFLVGEMMQAELWKKASLVLAPIGTKAGTGAGAGDGKLYSVKGSDFTTARNCKKGRIDINGYIRQVGLDEATIDYSGGKAAINAELQSTNKILYPFAAENSYWTKSGVTVDTNSGAFYPSPFKDASGNVLNVARKLVVTTAGNNLYNDQSITINSGDVWSESVIWKDSVNPLTFTGSTPAGTDEATSKELADGWYLHTLKRTFTASGSTVRVGITTTAIGDYYFSGQQFESGNPTSVINDPEDAEGNEVTRLQDLATNTTTDWVALLNGSDDIIFRVVIKTYDGVTFNCLAVGDKYIDAGSYGFGIVKNGPNYFRVAYKTDDGLSDDISCIFSSETTVNIVAKLDKSASKLKAWMNGTYIGEKTIAAMSFNTTPNKLWVGGSDAPANTAKNTIYSAEIYKNISDADCLTLSNL